MTRARTDRGRIRAPRSPHEWDALALQEVRAAPAPHAAAERLATYARAVADDYRSMHATATDLAHRYEVDASNATASGDHATAERHASTAREYYRAARACYELADDAEAQAARALEAAQRIQHASAGRNADARTPAIALRPGDRIHSRDGTPAEVTHVARNGAGYTVQAVTPGGATLVWRCSGYESFRLQRTYCPRH